MAKKLLAQWLPGALGVKNSFYSLRKYNKVNEYARANSLLMYCNVVSAASKSCRYLAVFIKAQTQHIPRLEWNFFISYMRNHRALCAPYFFMIGTAYYLLITCIKVYAAAIYSFCIKQINKFFFGWFIYRRPTWFFIVHTYRLTETVDKIPCRGI